MKICNFNNSLHAGFAHDVSNKARRGYYREHGMDDYTNGTLVLELKYSIILNWYQVYYPRDYQQIMADHNV